MAKTYEQLLEQAAIIRDETAAGKNTATRVGGTITDAVYYVKELKDTYAGIHAEASEAKTEAAAAKFTAAEAKTSAASALSNAKSAVLTANAASGTATEAKANADAAKATAEGIAATADAAQAEAAQIRDDLGNNIYNWATDQDAGYSPHSDKYYHGLMSADDKEKMDGLDARFSDIGNNISSISSTCSANTAKIESVESAATRAQETADRAQEAANTAQSAAETAQTAADAEKERNDAQDERLEAIENSVSHLSAAGRYWNEANGTPTAAGHYGSLDALRSLPEMLGLGRYLVKDDRTRRKLDPKDSTKYADDGTTAKLDGTEGQCMWCWNGFYANVWKEGDNLFKVVSFHRPVGNDISIWIPAGGISWLGAGVIDRGEAPYTDKTKWTLCSIISDPTLDPALYGPDFKAERYRGGGDTAIDASKYSKAPADTTPQITMLGMPATNISTTDFGTYARKRGEGWEANWFVARFVVEFLFEVIMGTENSQEAFNANKDADGLYQGGFGDGVTDIPDLWNYNGGYPLLPTSVGLEAGDGVCLVPYSLPQTNGVDGDTYKTLNVPVFFGLVGAGFGHLYQNVNGLIIDVGEEKSLAYVAPSMYAAYDPNTVADKILVAEGPIKAGSIKSKSYRGLCCMPTEVGGSSVTRFSDFFYTTKKAGLCVRKSGGWSMSKELSGVSCSFVHISSSYTEVYNSSTLCYFTEDPIIPESQSIV